MTKESVNPPELIDQFKIHERSKVVYTWMNSAKEVATKTGDPEAKSLIEFMDEHTALGTPQENGIHTFHAKPIEQPYEYYFYLTPFIDGDAEALGEEDARHKMAAGKDGGNIAQYRENSQAIYLPNIDMSGLGKGVLLLHEMMHAKNDIEHLIDRNSPNSHWLEEADIYSFEYQLLKSLGGEAYTSLVQKMKETMTVKIWSETLPLQLEYGYRPHKEDFDAIKEVLGLKNEWEINFWLGVSGHNALYDYLVDNVDDPRTTFAVYLGHNFSPPK